MPIYGGPPAPQTAAKYLATSRPDQLRLKPGPPPVAGAASVFDEVTQCDCSPRLCLPGPFLSLAGCTGGGIGNVSGEVKFNGELLPTGRITFVCKAGNQPAISSNIVDGRFEIRGIPVGPVDVTVETFNLRSDPVAGGPPPPPVPKGYKFVRIPARYGSVQESNLGFEVKRGDQKKDFELLP